MSAGLMALAAMLVTLASVLAAPAMASEAPVDKQAPKVSGTVEEGYVVRASHGLWSGSPTFAYQWQRCTGDASTCAEIKGATSSAYRPVLADVGNTLRVIVTATNEGGSASAPSAQTTKVAPGPPRLVAKPKVTGTKQDGKVLSASTGTWTGTPPLSFTYQWEYCQAKICSQITGATESTYRLATAQIGKAMRVTVHAQNAVGSKVTKSLLTSKVQAGPPVIVTAPKVSGTPIVTQTLSADTGSWAGTGPFTYAYQWLSCNLLNECTPIQGANSSTYTVQPLDVASSLEVEVTATGSLGAVSAASEPTNLAKALLPENTSLPTIGGLLQDGESLIAAVGSWTGTEPISYAYQWLQCDAVGANCEELKGDTGSVLGLVSSLVGSTVRVVVTATNSAGSVSKESEPTSAIAALLPANTALPSIAGDLLDGKTLTAVLGSWTGSTPLTYAYEWQQCNAQGEACKKIEGAVGSTLGLVSSLVGSTVRVVVTATNSGGSVSKASEPTSAIAALLPANTALPSIGGLLADGQTLTAAVGSWTGSTPLSYAYEWQQCNAQGESCKKIEGAVGSTLGLVSTLVGSTVRVVVTATNSGGSVSKASEPTSAIAALLPANTALPSIAGELLDGKTLTAAVGSWSGSTPLSYAYEWQQCNAKGESCKKIEGAVGSTLALVSGLVGSTVRVVVTATNSGGSVSKASEPTSAIAALLPSNTALPSIAGELLDGKTLTAAVGSWSGSTPLSYAYEWQQCNSKGEACKKIEGAAGSTLALVSGLVGSTVRVVVTATNSGGSVSKASEPTSAIAALLPSNTALPSIAGELLDGKTLTAAVGSWTGSTPLSYAYEWQQCNAKGEACKKIEGAAGSTLALVSSLVGSTVRVVVTATNSGGSVSKASEPTSAIAALLPANTALPSIAGELLDGKTLTAATGSWTGSTPLSYAYEWQQCNSKGEACKKIEGAASSTLALVSSLVGSTVRVVVTATNSGGSVSKPSEPTSAIAALLPANTALPSITGELLDGKTLTAAVGSWTGTAPITYGYQWEQCDTKGANCEELKGATGATLGLVSTLVGKTLRVAVTATNAGGSVTKTSEPTGLIAAVLPVASVLPTISSNGKNQKELEEGQTLTATKGSWEGTTPITYADRWQQCDSKGENCKNIESGGSGETLALVNSLIGSTVRVVVTATNSAGSVSKPSEATTPVLAILPANTVLPTISGLLKLEGLLKANQGTWTGSAPLTIKYQWQRCNALGEAASCANIEKANAVEYVLGLLDVGHTMRVVVTGSNSRGAVSQPSKITGLIENLL